MLASLAARRGVLVGMLVAALGVSAFCAGPALAKSKSHKSGKVDLNAVYTETNNVNANSIVVFKRHANGTLSFSQKVLTGGKGANDQPPFGFQVVDSSDSMRLSSDGLLLFAVNSGDNSVSSFRVTAHGLKLVSHKSSGGSFPVSLAVSGDLLYVLNEKSGNIAGLRFSSFGRLTPIRHSSQPLSPSGGAPADGAAAQIGFAPGGHVLNVTIRLTNTIDSFKMKPNDTPGSAVPTTTPTGAHNPFGFTYQGAHHLIVTNADAADTPMFSHSSVSSYSIAGTSLSPITPNLLSGGAATCWVVLTNNQRYAFASNTGSGGTPDAISIFSVASSGALTLTGHAPATAGFTSDLGLSSDSRYLYVLLPSNVVNPFTATQAPAPATSHIDEYRVGPGGTLTPIGSTPSNLPDGLSGLQAW
jgi:6-phosphogluconolactonase